VARRPQLLFGILEVSYIASPAYAAFIDPAVQTTSGTSHFVPKAVLEKQRF
jgi:hypothetical protein